MIYALLRAIAGVALRWYYRGIEVRGLARVPREGPVLFVVNHPNQLVDALVVGWVVPRRVSITAKSTLFTNPLLAWLLTSVGVIPLLRASDVRSSVRSGGPSRNDDAFESIHAALERGAAVLIFPEGVSHDEPNLAPLRTGAARIALDARARGISNLTIVPVGLTFEKKEEPRSRIFMQVGEPLVVSAWIPSGTTHPVAQLTAELTARLGSVTLSYDSLDDAARAAALAGTVTRLLLVDAPAVGADGPSLGDEAAVARRIEVLREQLARADRPDLRAWGLRIALSVHRLRAELRAEGIRFGDITISTRWADGLRFVLREAWVLAVAGPIALWGGLNHFIPLGLARLIGEWRRGSASDPPMRTIVAGALLVTIGYLAQGIVVAFLFGPRWAIVYLVSLPISADVNFRLRDRLRRVARRAHAFRRFRKAPGVQAKFEADVAQLRAQALAFETATRERGVASAGS